MDTEGFRILHWICVITVVNFVMFKDFSYFLCELPYSRSLMQKCDFPNAFYVLYYFLWLISDVNLPAHFF